MSNKKIFKSGWGSNIGSWSQLNKKDVDSVGNDISTESQEEIEDQLNTQGDTAEVEVPKEMCKTSSEIKKSKEHKAKLPSCSQLVADLNKKVDKVLGKGLYENTFTNALKSKLENLNVDKMMSKSQNSGISIVEGDIFDIHTSGFYYASDRAINTPRAKAGYFILEVLSPRDKQITFVNHNDMTTFMAQEVDGLRSEWLEDIFFTPSLKDKLEGLPSGNELRSDLDGKVDKVVGKSLSANNYTDKDKAKLDSINLSHIVTGTTNNAINAFNEDIQTITKSGFYYANTMATNKPVSTNGYLIVESTNDTNANLTYVVYNSGDVYRTQKVSGELQPWIKDEIFQEADKKKLDGIETGANNYMHPDTHAIDEVKGLTAALNKKEPSISKKTAFNKNFGTTSDTVMQGNDSRIGDGQAAYAWGNHAIANYLQTDASGNLGLGTDSPQQKLHVNGGFARVENVYGYADFGAEKTSSYHFKTDCSQFYLNKPTQIDGDIKVYGKNTYMSHNNGGIYENGQRISTQSYVNQKEQSLNNKIEALESTLNDYRMMRMVVDKKSDELQMISNTNMVIVRMPLEDLRKEILK